MMPWTELEIKGIIHQVHFSPGKDYISGKVGIEEIHAEIRKALRQIDDGDFNECLPEHDVD
jgi:hypothetical protein